jgi:phage terminase large subunit GpA-like protein
LTAGLTTLVDMLLGREWPREDGTTARIEQLVVDANWGQSTQTVREFCRRHSSSAIILRSHGRGIGPTARPIHDGKKKPGEQIGSSPGTAKARADAEVGIGSSDFLERLGKVA